MQQQAVWSASWFYGQCVCEWLCVQGDSAYIFKADVARLEGLLQVVCLPKQDIDGTHKVRLLNASTGQANSHSMSGRERGRVYVCVPVCVCVNHCVERT